MNCCPFIGKSFDPLVCARPNGASPQKRHAHDVSFKIEGSVGLQFAITSVRLPGFGVVNLTVLPFFGVVVPLKTREHHHSVEHSVPQLLFRIFSIALGLAAVLVEIVFHPNNLAVVLAVGLFEYFHFSVFFLIEPNAQELILLLREGLKAEQKGKQEQALFHAVTF